MRSVLLVEDDDFFREALRDYLNKKSFRVTEAPNGKVAKDILGTQEFDLVITDIQMPFLTGIELIEWLRSRSNTPVVVITGFSHLVETQRAHELGVRDFLAKPFKNAELDAVINRIIAPADSRGHQENIEDSFCKVSIEEFVARPKIDFDVYVKLSEKKYVRIGYSGHELPRSQIESYKSKGLRFLHIKKDDFNKLVEFNLQMAGMISKTDSISQEKRLNFMKYTSEVILEKAFVAGVDESSLHEAKELLNLTVNTLTQNQTHLDFLNLLNSHSDYIYAHSLGVSLYAIMIARKMNFESNSVFFKLSLAGLYHDIGKKEMDREILEKPRPLLMAQERKMIESHPARGREILLSIKGIPNDVIQLVYEHHEDKIGLGYPRGIKARDSHPLSPILQLANHFVEHALKSPHSEGMRGAAAVSHIENLYLDRLDGTALLALKSIFK